MNQSSEVLYKKYGISLSKAKVFDNEKKGKEVYFVSSADGDAFGEFDTEIEGMEQMASVLMDMGERITHDFFDAIDLRKAGTGNLKACLAYAYPMEKVFEKSLDLQSLIKQQAHDIERSRFHQPDNNDMDAKTILVAQLSNGECAVLVNGTILLTATLNDSAGLRSSLGLMAKTLSNVFQARDETVDIDINELPENWDWQDVENYIANPKAFDFSRSSVI